MNEIDQKTTAKKPISKDKQNNSNSKQDIQQNRNSLYGNQFTFNENQQQQQQQNQDNSKKQPDTQQDNQDLTPLEQILLQQNKQVIQNNNSNQKNSNSQNTPQKQQQFDDTKKQKQTEVQQQQENQQQENLEDTVSKKPKFYAYSDFKKSQLKRNNDQQLNRTDKKQNNIQNSNNKYQQQIQQQQNQFDINNTIQQEDQQNDNSKENDKDDVQLGQAEKLKFQDILSNLGQQIGDIDQCMNRINNKSQYKNNRSLYQNSSTKNQSQLNYNDKLNLSQPDLLQLEYLQQQQNNNNNNSTLLDKNFDIHQVNQQQSQLQDEDPFWQIHQGDNLERKYRHLTKQGYMQDQTFSMILGLKPKSNLNKVKISRGQRVKINEKDTPEQILHRYIYNNGKDPKYDKVVGKNLRDREIDLLNKKYKDLNIQYSQSSQLPQRNNQDISKFENQFKYMKYFQHNKDILDYDEKHLKNSQFNIQSQQNNSNLNQSQIQLSNISNNHNRLYRGQYKNKDPNSTLKNYLQQTPNPIQEAQYEESDRLNQNQQQNNPIYQRYGVKYKKQLDDVFNEQYERNFNPTYNKNRLIENMNPDLRRQVRSESVGKFVEFSLGNNKIKTNKSAYQHNRSTSQNTFYTENNNSKYRESNINQNRSISYNSNNNINKNKQSFYDISPTKTMANSRHIRSVSYQNTPLRNNQNTQLRSHSTVKKRPCCLPKHISSIKKDLIINPQYDIQLPYNLLEKNKQKQQKEILDQNYKNLESQYYGMYGSEVHNQSKETISLLDSVFDKNKHYSQNDINNLLYAFKQKYSSLAQMQNNKMNQLKNQYQHYLQFNIPEDDLISNYEQYKNQQE